MLVSNQVAGKLGFNRQPPIAQMPGCPGGTPQLANGRGARCDPRCPFGSMRPAVCFANVASPLIHVLCP